MRYQGLELVLQRYRFFQNQSHNLFLINLGLFFLMTLLGGFIWYLHSTAVTPRYFPSSTDGVPIEQPALNQPYLKDPELIAWVKKVSRLIYSFDYINYRLALQDVRPYFTNFGYNNYLTALKESNNLETVKIKKQILSTEIVGEPVIVKQQLVTNSNPNRYGWQVRFNLLSKFDSADSTESLFQNLKGEMFIVRVSTLESPNGVAIQNFRFSAGELRAS